MKLFNVLTLLFFVVATSGADGAGDKVANFLRLSESAEAEVGLVSFASLIEETNLPAEISSSLKTLSLGSAPDAGELIVYSENALAQSLERFISNIKNDKSKRVLKAASVQIPHEVRVEGAGWNSSIATQKKRFQKQVQQLCLAACEVLVEEFNPPTYKDSYSKRAKVTVGTVSKIPKGTFSIETKVTLDGQLLENSWTQGRIRVFQDVGVATKILPAGSRLQAGDFEAKHMDVTMETDTPAQLDKLNGARLGRTLSPSQILLNNAITRETDVVFGQPLKAILKSDDWQVSVDAVSRGTGSVGDRIRVLNPSTKKELSGVLISKGVVEIK